MTQRLDEAAARDTLAAVFRDGDYARSLRATLWDRITSWIGGLFDRLFDAIGASPAAQWGARAAVAVVLGLLLARVAYVLWQRFGGDERTRLARRRMAGDAGDPWARAQQEAAAGRYTDAAHLLYQALLVALAGRERLRLHPSKTVGDYARELRARSSSAFPGYRDFARLYETVVYGLQHCDRERWERLHALAVAITGPRG